MMTIEIVGGTKPVARLVRERGKGATVAPLPKSFLGGDMVELSAEDGLPEIGNYSLAMFVTPDATPPVKAAADHLRATFEAFHATGQV